MNMLTEQFEEDTGMDGFSGNGYSFWYLWFELMTRHSLIIYVLKKGAIFCLKLCYLLVLSKVLVFLVHIREHRIEELSICPLFKALFGSWRGKENGDNSQNCYSGSLEAGVGISAFSRSSKKFA